MMVSIGQLSKKGQRSIELSKMNIKKLDQIIRDYGIELRNGESKYAKVLKICDYEYKSPDKPRKTDV